MARVVAPEMGFKATAMRIGLQFDGHRLELEAGFEEEYEVVVRMRGKNCIGMRLHEQPGDKDADRGSLRAKGG
jgi:hypothetical protein